MTTPKNDIDYRSVSEILRYDPDTGKLFWLSSLGRRVKGAVAGWEHITNRGRYRSVQINGRGYRCHRIAWLLYYGRWPKGEIDHINGDGTDNRITNLRDVTRSVNQRNVVKRHKASSSQWGVHWHTGIEKWCASITVDGEHHHLGSFDTEGEAIAARKDAESLHNWIRRPGPASESLMEVHRD